MCVAIEHDNLDVLKWAVENGCPCDDETYTRGLIFREIYSSGIEGTTYKLCGLNKHIDIVKYWSEKVSEGVIV